MRSRSRSWLRSKSIPVLVRVGSCRHTDRSQFWTQTRNLSHSAFYRAMLSIRGTSHEPVSVCVCLSVTSRSSIETGKRIGLVLAWGLHSTYPILCYKEIHVPSKMRVLPSGILLQTHDLKNFATAHRSSKRAINLDRERCTLYWTVVVNYVYNTSELRRSTTIIYHTDRQALSTARFCHADQSATAEAWFRPCRTSSFCTVAW